MWEEHFNCGRSHFLTRRSWTIINRDGRLSTITHELSHCSPLLVRDGRWPILSASCCCHFSAKMDCNLNFWAQLNPFFPQLLFSKVFYHNSQKRNEGFRSIIKTLTGSMNVCSQWLSTLDIPWFTLEAKFVQHCHTSSQFPAGFSSSCCGRCHKSCKPPHSLKPQLS